MKRNNSIQLAFLLLSMFFVQSVQGTLYNIDFKAGYPGFPTYIGKGILGAVADNTWNGLQNASTTKTNVALVDARGAASTATFSSNGFGGDFGFPSPPIFAWGNFSDFWYLDATHASATVSINNLPAGQSYDLILYCFAGDTGEAMQASVNGGTQQATSGVKTGVIQWSENPDAKSNLLRFTGTVPVSGIVSIALSRPNTSANIQGMQLQIGSISIPAQGTRTYKLIPDLAAGYNLKVMTIGTSLTDQPYGVSWPSQLYTALYPKYQGHIMLSNRAISGSNSRSGKANIEAWLAADNPDVVFIEYAINDAVAADNITVTEMKSNLDFICAKIKANNPNADIILQTMNNPVGAALTARPNLDLYYQGFRDYAALNGYKLVDNYPLWKNLYDSNPTQWATYVPDNIHPNDAGRAAVMMNNLVTTLETTPVANQTINIYWLCNSFTGLTGLQSTLKNMINSNPACGKTVNLSDANILWGQNLDAHWVSTTSMNAIKSGTYQYVVLQGYINAGANEIVVMRDTALAAGLRISNEVKAHAGIPLIFSHQANCNSDQQRWDFVTAGYRQLAANANATFVPAGLSWLEAKVLSPGFVTHDPDCHHQNEAGNYLNACVFYYKITGKSPVGLSYKTSNAITFDAPTALMLQQAAANVVEREIAQVVAVTGVSLSPTSTSVMEGSSTTLTATVSPANASNKNIAWTSSNSAVASVDATGTVVGLTIGSTTITATTADGSFSAQCALNVIVSTLVRVSNIALEAPTATMEVKQTRTLASTIAPLNASNKNVTWLSSNPLVATVSANGLITALTTGTTKITVTTEDGLKSAECMLTVNADVTAPSVPTNLTNGTITSSSVVLNWIASTDVVGVTGYDVYNGANLAGSTASTTYTVTGLSAKTNYSFTVKAKDFATNTSVASTALSVTTLDAPAGFRYLRLNVLSQTDMDIYFTEIEWMDGATTYPKVKATGSSASITATLAGSSVWKVYDGISGGNGSSWWQPGAGPYPFSITLDLGAGVAIYPSSIKIGVDYKGRSMGSFTCEGSTNNSSWTTLLSKSGLTKDNWTGNSMNTFIINVPTTVLAKTLSNDKNIVIYPNPVIDLLHLNFEMSIENATLEVCSLQGSKLMTKLVRNSETETLDIRSLKSGIYFVKMKSADKTLCVRFIKN